MLDSEELSSSLKVGSKLQSYQSMSPPGLYVYLYVNFFLFLICLLGFLLYYPNHEMNISLMRDGCYDSICRSLC